MNSRILKGGVIGMAMMAVALLAGSASNRANAPDAKSLFVANGCNTCHSILALGIAKTGTTRAPDLSGVGLRHDAGWIAQYLNKTVELNGKKHTKKWKGTPADLTTVSSWLAGLKRK